MFTIIPTPQVVLAESAQQPSVSFDQLAVNTTQLNQTFTLNIEISNVQNLWGWTANVTFDNAYIKLQRTSDGSFLTSQGASDLYLASKPTNYQDPYSNIQTLQLVSLQAAIDSYSNGQDQSASGNGVLGNTDIPNNKTDRFNIYNSRR